MKNEDADFGWGVVVNFNKKTNVKVSGEFWCKNPRQPVRGVCDRVRFPVQSSTDAEPLYVVEVLLHCSKESVKDSATEAAKPAGPGEVGEMQVGRGNTRKPSCHTHTHQHGRALQRDLFLQVVPVMVQLLSALSSVRLYIPKDLKPLDNRQLMLKSIQVSPWRPFKMSTTDGRSVSGAAL